VDFQDTYNQLRTSGESEYLTTFAFKYSCFSYRVMPLSLSVTTAHFQRFINAVLRKFLGWDVIVYLDDILISLYALTEHVNQEHEVIHKLERKKLSACLLKCKFFTQTAEFLGMSISQRGLTIKPKSFFTLEIGRIPNTVNKLQSFIGFSIYLRQLVCN
jgi:Reverse transcriptase (RNA-dependent DNA polymerase)